MPLASYHIKYLQRSDEELRRRADVKEEELKRIFSSLHYQTPAQIVRIAVLGCADRRFISHHRRIFEKLLARAVELTTFDIIIEHLQGEENILQHDCTLPLPHPPYDITFGHVFLKFIETEKQWSVLKNSYDALRAPGIAIHVFDEEDVTTVSLKQADGLWSVPLERWKRQLADQGIAYQVLHWNIDVDYLPIPIRGLKGGALVLEKYL